MDPFLWQILAPPSAWWGINQDLWVQMEHFSPVNHPLLEPYTPTAAFSFTCPASPFILCRLPIEVFTFFYCYISLLYITFVCLGPTCLPFYADLFRQRHIFPWGLQQTWMCLLYDTIPSKLQTLQCGKFSEGFNFWAPRASLALEIVLHSQRLSKQHYSNNGWLCLNMYAHLKQVNKGHLRSVFFILLPPLSLINLNKMQ